MSVIDFHSHVLPRIDDGSHSSEESLGILQISASQGIDVMAATSHFYATEDRISSFLNRRRCSEERLKERMNQELTKGERIPRLIMGAEVAFFTGISRAERLEELTYEGTDLLLLEMPFTKWSKSEIEEVRYILERRKLRVMLAHLERFLMIPGNKKGVYELMELPVYVQINAGSFERWGERRQILKMIRKKEQIFLGSDCHGLNHRVPNLKNGREALEKMMGSTFIDKMDYAVKNWWLSLLVGLLYIIVAIYLMFAPLASYVALSILFSVSMFVSGLFEIAFALANKKGISSWGWYLAGGIIDLILGIFLMASPGLSMEVLPFVLAFWLMFRGFSATGYSMDLKRYGTRNWGWYMVFGILAILCSIGVIWQPALGAFTLVYMIAYALLIIGIFRVMLSFELKSLHKRNKEAQAE